MNTQSSPALPRLALIAGPTASGKSALALAFAERTGGVIINADASQIYTDLAILSARPRAEDLARAPHRLFGFRDGAVPCSAAEWAALARAEIADAHAAGRLPILVGGTGMYLRTLLDGIAPVPPIDPAVRVEVRALASGAAREALAALDPEAAARLGAGDRARIARALEVIRSTGRPLAAWQADRLGGIADRVRLAPLVLLPDRAWLHARCDARFTAMLEGGAIAEVAALLARRLDPGLPVMRAIGVAQIARLVAGEIDRDTALALGQAATRQYAKRQYTWFRHQPPAGWPRLVTQSEMEDAVQNVIKLLK